MRLTLIRNATLLLELGGARFLIDPMLADAGAYPPIGDPDGRRNPLVPLPRPAQDVVDAADAVIVTHLHNDHFDRAAAELLPKEIPLFCQPGDEVTLRERGFGNVTPVATTVTALGVELTRTAGRHGTRELGESLGPVSGFVFAAPAEPTTYIAGDTVWCDEVADALTEHRPVVTVVNAAGARLGDSDPIVMTPGDVEATVSHAPWTRVVAVHLEALNHCPVTRAELRASRLAILVPEDGEELVFD